MSKFACDHKLMFIPLKNLLMWLLFIRRWVNYNSSKKEKEKTKNAIFNICNELFGPHNDVEDAIYEWKLVDGI